MLLKRRKHNSRRANKAREYPGHRAWVRGFSCIVPGCEVDDRDPETFIDAAHCRRNTDGGGGLKPHDKWCFPACRRHHAEQHRGDLTFEAKYGVDCRETAIALAAKSPHRFKWLEAEND
jgi:hypothetical protein